ncbi:hypothetical protein HN747_04630 [archaeon]|jgi:hypothetical protein|nr:hypothetical protein [archaeon]
MKTVEESVKDLPRGEVESLAAITLRSRQGELRALRDNLCSHEGEFGDHNSSTEITRSNYEEQKKFLSKYDLIDLEMEDKAYREQRERVFNFHRRLGQGR